MMVIRSVCNHCALRHITHPTQYLPPSAFPHKHLCPAFTFTFFSLSLSTQYLPPCASFPTNIFAHLVYKIKAFIAFSFPQHPFHVASYCFLQKTIVFPLSLSSDSTQLVSIFLFLLDIFTHFAKIFTLFSLHSVF